MLNLKLSEVGLALLASLPGCYAAAGPTIGLDLKTGRALVGAEASAESFTIAESIALGSPPAALLPAAQGAGERSNGQARSEPVWRRRTHFLWEPGVMSGTSNRSFAFGAIGGTVGLTLEHYDVAAMTLQPSAGMWIAAGQTLRAANNSDCSGDDVRPYALLVIGFRGGELYAAPKLGILNRPRECDRLPGFF